MLLLRSIPKASYLVARNKLFQGTPNTVFDDMGNLNCFPLRELEFLLSFLFFMGLFDPAPISFIILWALRASLQEQDKLSAGL